jgi:hypothetical protein
MSSNRIIVYHHYRLVCEFDSRPWCCLLNTTALDTICKKCFEDINEVIISRKSKDRQYKDHKKKGKQ